MENISKIVNKYGKLLAQLMNENNHLKSSKKIFQYIDNNKELLSTEYANQINTYIDLIFKSDKNFSNTIMITLVNYYKNITDKIMYLIDRFENNKYKLSSTSPDEIILMIVRMNPDHTLNFSNFGNKILFVTKLYYFLIMRIWLLLEDNEEIICKYNKDTLEITISKILSNI